MDERYLVLHEYMHLVRSKILPALLCPWCEDPMMLVDRDGDPVLWCPFDDAETKPGLTMMNELKEKMNAIYI